jgi:hypothetical protein
MPASAGTFIEDDAPRYREDPWKRAAITFLTWLYRRDETGLSDEQMEAESVPVSTKYARDRLDHVGLSSLTYERRLDIGPEPWRKSPDPHPHPERPTGIRVTGSSDVQLLDNRFSGDMDAIVADKTTGLTAERNIVDAKPPKAVWPPALDDVPAAGRRARVQDYTSSRDEVITLGKNLKSRLWGYSLYQLERKKGSLEEQDRAFMAAVDRHNTDWWMKGSPGAVDLGTKVEPVNPAAQVLWQAEMSARIDAELKWFDEHPVP